MSLFNFKKQPVQNSLSPVLKKPNYEKYVDPTGEFSSKRLKYSLWFTEHEVLLYKFSIASLIIFSIVVWGLSIWWWSGYLNYELSIGSRNRKILVNFTPSVSSISFKPTSVAVVDTVITPGGVDKYDISSEVVNPNERFLVSFEYYFLVDGEKTPIQKTTLLPKEDRPIAYFGLKKSQAPGNAILIPQNFSWKRIANTEITDTDAWQREHLNFVVKDFLFTRSESTDGVGSHIITFTLANLSSYSYKAPRFYIALLFQQSLVGLIPIEVSNFKSLEERKIDVRSFVPTVSITDVKVFPLINIYNPEEFLKPER